jgi:hypothetical protein
MGEFVVYDDVQPRGQTEVKAALELARRADPKIVHDILQFRTGEEACSFMSQMKEQNEEDRKGDKNLPNLNIRVAEGGWEVVRGCSITKYEDGTVSSILAHFGIGGTDIVSEADLRSKYGTKEQRKITTDLSLK